MSIKGEQSQSGTRRSWFRTPLALGIAASLAVGLTASVAGDLNGLGVGKKAGVAACRTTSM